jgi:hypothetical protein
VTTWGDAFGPFPASSGDVWRRNANALGGLAALPSPVGSWSVCGLLQMDDDMETLMPRTKCVRRRLSALLAGNEALTSPRWRGNDHQGRGGQGAGEREQFEAVHGRVQGASIAMTSLYRVFSPLTNLVLCHAVWGRLLGRLVRSMNPKTPAYRGNHVETDDVDAAGGRAWWCAAMCARTRRASRTLTTSGPMTTWPTRTTTKTSVRA